MKGKLIVISGPSGVGKSTIRQEILKKVANIWYSISATTRKPRENEKNGIDYYFLTKEEFKEQINNDNFIEYVEVYHDTFYGTLKSEVEKKLNNGINVILEIDVDGAIKIKNKYNDAILIFIAPPDIEQLKKRLETRNTEDENVITERINKAKYELSKKDYYDYIIINDDIARATNEISDIIKNI